MSTYLSICAIYRDEAPYLVEWIEFHRLVGVEHFYLYDGFKRLLTMAQSGPCEARVGAARALGRLGDQEAVNVLQSMAVEPRGEEQQNGLLAQAIGCNPRVAAHDALEQIRGAP